MRITYSAVDWLTATAKTDGRAQDLARAAVEAMEHDVAAGNTRKASRLLGYEGWASGHVFYGWRMDSVMVRLSGPMAERHWYACYQHADNVSRLDVAIVAQVEPTGRDVAREIWDSLPAKTGHAGAKLDYTLIQSREGASTLYVGKRASERFGRVYNKHAESGGAWPAGSWRYEIEYKGSVALAVGEQLWRERDQRASVLSLVTKRFAEWNIDTPWPVTATAITDTVVYSTSDDSRRMRWLETQVAPAIEKLSVRYSATEIRTALGISDPRPAARLDQPPTAVQDTYLQ